MTRVRVCVRSDEFCACVCFVVWPCACVSFVCACACVSFACALSRV